jgi:CheY-like chemotaxis protein
VCEAENGSVALEKIRENAPSLVLLDLMMPEMDGFTFLAELRKSTPAGTMPVIIVTAKDLTPDERTRLNGGVQRVLQKGNYSREQLLDQISRTIREYGGGQSVTAG